MFAEEGNRKDAEDQTAVPEAVQSVQQESGTATHSITYTLPRQTNRAQLNRPVHKASYTFTILSHSSGMMLQPINLWDKKILGFCFFSPTWAGCYQSCSGTDLKCVSEVWANLVRLAYELVCCHSHCVVKFTQPKLTKQVRLERLSTIAYSILYIC